MNSDWNPEKVKLVDATWQHRHEEALTTEGYAVWDWDMVTNRASWKGDCEAFGYSAEELAGDAMIWAGLMHPDDALGMDDEVRRILDTKYPDHASRTEAWSGTRQLTYRIRQKDGTYMRVSDDGKFFFDQNRKATRAIGIVSRASDQ